MSSNTLSPEEVGRKWDKLITGSLYHTGKGLGLGLLVSLLFFKRRSWPVVAGIGFGLGLSYSDIEKELPYLTTSTSENKL